MTSLNYAIFGKPFTLQGTFRVLLRMTPFHLDRLDYDEVAECGAATSASELRKLIAKASSLQFVDFGNGLIGLHGECSDFHFCAVPEQEEPVGMEPNRGVDSENSNPEDIF